MSDLKLTSAEYGFMEIIWLNEPVNGSRLVKIRNEVKGWKKSTTYTMLKRLGDKGVVQNNNSVITSLVSKKQVQLYESNRVVNRSFGGDISGFVAAFMDGKKLSKQEADKLRSLIDSFEE